MSKPFRDKNKDLVKLKAVTAEVVWTKDKNGKLLQMLNDTEYICAKSK